MDGVELEPDGGCPNENGVTFDVLSGVAATFGVVAEAEGPNEKNEFGADRAFN